MEASFVKNEIMQSKAIYNGSLEIGVESDIVLPDYLEDIERILKCALTPRINSKRHEGNRLVIGGTAFLRLVYLSPDGKVRNFESRVPFAKTVDLPQEADSAFSRVRVRCEYSNCHAQSPRRFSLNAALSLKVCVKNKVPVTLVSDIENAIVEVKKKKGCAVVPVCAISESFTVMEEYELAGENVDSVSKMTATVNVIEHKIVSGRLIVKGEISLSVWYICQQSEKAENAKFIIPINHIMTADGADEGDRTKIEIDVSKMSAEIIEGGKNEIAVEILLNVLAQIDREEEFEAVVDAYCIGYESACSVKEVPVCVLAQTASKMQEFYLPIEADSAHFIDVFASVKEAAASVNAQGEIMANCTVCAGALVRDSQDEVFYTDKITSQDVSIAADRRFCGGEVECEAKIVSAEQVAGKNEIKVTVLIECEIEKNQKFGLIDSLDISDIKTESTDDKTALTLYFAQEGEDAFDIAKRYNTSAKAVMLQNGLEDMKIQRNCKILIPMVK